jgi:heme A synthase
MMGGGGFGGGVREGSDRRFATPGLRLSNGQAADPFSAPTTGSATASTPPAAPAVITGDVYENVAAGLASLDFRLPERGRVYSFTTPRGQIEITARPVAHTLVGRLMGLAALAAVVLIVWAASRRPAREAYSHLFSTVASGVLLAIVGLLSLITGVFPVAGLVLMVIGIVLAIRNRVVPRALAA